MKMLIFLLISRFTEPIDQITSYIQDLDHNCIIKSSREKVSSENVKLSDSVTATTRWHLFFSDSCYSRAGRALKPVKGKVSNI